MSEHWWDESLSYSARTDVGMRRSNNQDSHCAAPASSMRIWSARGHLFIVADGMGAHAAGEKASRMAVDTVEQSYLKRLSESPADALRSSILEAHDAIKRKGDSDPSFRDMGTTCDALAILPGKAYVGHVGDSRVYRIRDRAIEQLTFDHSLVWEVKYLPSVRDAYRNAENVPKNVITRSLGPTENLEVDVEGPFETRPGDAFLMCSDGLSGQLDDSEIGQIVEIFKPEEATESLINLANLRGGPDNSTVIVARVLSDPSPEEIEREIKSKSKKYEKREPLSPMAIVALIAAIALLALGAILCCASGSTAKPAAPTEAAESAPASAARSNDNVALPLGIGSLVLAAVCGGLFCFLGRRTLFGVDAKRAEDLNPRGKAPYVRASAAPTAEFGNKIASMCDELCVALKDKGERFAPD